MSFLDKVKQIGGAVVGGIVGGPAGAMAGYEIGGSLGGSKGGSTNVGAPLPGGSSGGSYDSGDWMNAGLGIAEKAYDNYSAAEAATDAFDRQKWMASNAYQLKVEDLKRAGLNPMLAVTTGGAQFPGVNIARTDFGGSSAGQLRLQQAAVGRADEGLKLLTREQVDENIALIVAQQNLTKAQEDQVERAMAKINADIDKINADTAEAWVKAELAGLDRDQRKALFNSVIQATNANTWLSIARLPEAQAEAEKWKKAGWLLPWLREGADLFKGW